MKLLLKAELLLEIKGIPLSCGRATHSKRIALSGGNYWMVDDQERCVSIRMLHAFIRSWVPDFVDESEDEDQNDDESKDGRSNVHEMGKLGCDSDVCIRGGRNDNVENLNDCNMEEANVIFSGNRSTMNSKDDGADSMAILNGPFILNEWLHGARSSKDLFTINGSPTRMPILQRAKTKGAETSSHLFFSCCMVRQVVRLITCWWDVPYMEFESYDGWLAWLVNLRLPYKNKMMLEGVFYVMWWHIWTFRNKTIFEAKAPAKALFFDDVVWMGMRKIGRKLFKVVLRRGGIGLDGGGE
ncbi:hypothetical protein Tco_0320261 [Tanacetum coccineum]